ncbi:MAG: 33 kDa chaperonin [bacterium ADurb.Bin429]|nr:MAG: 33 kDa chaperonin [bacterium ADurb.Bin429]
MIRAIAARGMARAFAINATRLCEKARKAQNSLPAATAALGRLLSAAVMMGGTIKEGERIILRVEADGPVEGIYAEAYPDGRVRGYLRNPHVNPPSREGKLDVGRAVGTNGELIVVRDLRMRVPYIGRVPLQSGEIGDDLAYYFATSEQQPAAVGLGVLVDVDNSVLAAGGYIVQPLTGASEDVIAHLEANIRTAPPPTDLVLAHRDPEAMLAVLLAGMEMEVLERITPRFFCGCTRAKSRLALRALGEAELREMIAAGEPALVNCDFCAKHYEFTPPELEKLLGEMRQANPDDARE